MADEAGKSEPGVSPNAPHIPDGPPIVIPVRDPKQNEPKQK